MDPYRYTTIGSTPKETFENAVSNGDLEAIKEVIDEVDVNVPNFIGDTPIFIAIANYDHLIVKFLIDYGVDTNLENMLHFSPLILAIYRKDVESVKILLEGGVDPNFITSKFFTALNFAIQTNQIDVIKLLADYGADFNFIDESGDSYLMLCILKGLCDEQDDFLPFILSKTKNVNHQNNCGSTSLIYAITRGSRLVKMLLDAGADVNFQAMNFGKGETPIFKALRETNKQPNDESIKILKLLLNVNVNIYVRNLNGVTPLQISEKCSPAVQNMIHGVEQRIQNVITGIVPFIKQHRSAILFNLRSKIISLIATDPRTSECSEKDWVTLLKSAGYWNLLSISFEDDMYTKWDAYLAN